MRVLFVSWRGLDHRLAGGSEVLIDRLATGLTERGHDVTLLADGPSDPSRVYETVDSGGRLRQYLTNPITARRLDRPDVIVDVCNGIPFFTPLWSRVPTVALVNHIHFGMWREWFSPAVSFVGSTIETRVMPRVYRHSRMVAVSDSTARSLMTLGIPEDNISLVHNGVEVADIGHRTTPRATEPTFLAIGRLVPHKRFDLLLRAWAHVQPNIGGRLLIAGDGPLRAELAAKLPPGAELLGRVSEREKRSLMESAWFIVQTSRLEGWGLVVMEAAAAGTPTLGFWAPGTRDAVLHGESGLLVRTELELVGAWTELAMDAEQRRVLSKGATERAMHFSWERTVDDFELVLGETTGVVPPPSNEVGDASRATAVDRPTPSHPRGLSLRTKAELFKLFLHEKQEPGQFYRRLADEWVALLPYHVAGQRILDLGSGSGEMTEALRRHGANAIGIDLSVEGLQGGDPRGQACADGRTLPFADASMDGVVCSNMLEHTPDPAAILHEIARVLRPGGWAWVSWTNWYSPWGGHEIVPLHYLGPNRGLQAWRRLFGEPRKNVPFDGLWPTYISQVLQMAQSHPAFETRATFPRYYPSQRWITRTPGLREVATWNCVLQLERRRNVTLEPEPPLLLTAPGPRAAARRGMRRVRQAMGDNPVFLPLLLRATPLGTSRRITSETELVIEGFPRSGNTFAHFAVLHAEPGAVVTSRVHTPSQVKLAAQRGVPVLLTIRGPVESVASAAVATVHVPLPSLLLEYVHHYEQLYSTLDKVVVATFEEITEDFDDVIRALNSRFSLGFKLFGHTPEHEAAVFDSIARHHREHWGDDETRLPMPVESQRHLKERVRAEVHRPEYASLLQEAQTVYDTIAARSVRAGGTPTQRGGDG